MIVLKNTMDELVAKLKRICEMIVKDKSVQPKDGKTHCDWALNLICSHMGCSRFSDPDLLANKIYDILESEWAKVDASWAREFAMSGGLAVAAQKGKPHGHVAVVYPGPMVYSGKWKSWCPTIANVGRTCEITGANNGFVNKPDYFVFKTVQEMHEVREKPKA